jgi:hypothetical protein
MADLVIYRIKENHSYTCDKCGCFAIYRILSSFREAFCCSGLNCYSIIYDYVKGDIDEIP